jgi:hypothetical protein
MRIRARQNTSHQNPLKAMDGTPRRVDKGRAQGRPDPITCSSLRFETNKELKENRDGDYQTTCRCRQFARIDASGSVRSPNLRRPPGFSGLSRTYPPLATGGNDGVRGALRIPRKKNGWKLVYAPAGISGSPGRREGRQRLWNLLTQICGGRDLRVEKSKCNSAIRPTEEMHPKRSLRWRESVHARRLLLGAGPSLGFVSIYKPILPTNSSAWEKDSRPGSLNKTISHMKPPAERKSLPPETRDR